MSGYVQPANDADTTMRSAAELLCGHVPGLCYGLHGAGAAVMHNSVRSMRGKLQLAGFCECAVCIACTRAIGWY